MFLVPPEAICESVQERNKAPGETQKGPTRQLPLIWFGSAVYPCGSGNLFAPALSFATGSAPRFIDEAIDQSLRRSAGDPK